MKKFAIITVCLLMCCGASAQELNNFNRGGRQRVVSPEVKEGKMTFRLNANQASQVMLQGNWMDGRDARGIPMTKGENGIWEITIDAPAPEIYTYNFVVDGVSVNDPQNFMVQRDGTRYLNMVLVPGERSENYSEANQRGTVSYMWYDSKILGINRRLTVYTPYGYETSKQDYPVLYLLHGAGGDEEAWVSMGRAAQILDNLIEKGLAKPMIVVMPNGNPGQQAAQPLGLKEKQIDRRAPGMQDAYVKSLCGEIVPFIEKNFRVVAKPESRAIAGLSMGGGHTITATNLYPEMFDWICPLSAAGNSTPEQIKALKQAGVKLYFLCCGTSDFLWNNSVTLDKTMTDCGLEHTFFKSDGGHVWANWRLYLNTFAQKLFK